MSESTTNADTPSAQPPSIEAKPKKLGVANIISGFILLLLVGFGLYIGSFWWSYNSRISRLKAKNGDFVQLQRTEEELDEAANRGRRRGSEDADSESAEKKEGEKKADKGLADSVDGLLKSITPAPIQVVYWKHPSLEKQDVDLLMEFSDVEMLSIKCNEIDDKSIARLLTLPKLQRLRISSTSIGYESIDKWLAPKDLINVTLTNTSWKSKDMDDVRTIASKNKSLEGKFSVSNSNAPSLGGS